MINNQNGNNAQNSINLILNEEIESNHKQKDENDIFSHYGNIAKIL